MAKKKEEKTNVMRVLEQKKVPYQGHTYPHDGETAPDGVSVARSLGQDPACVFKTLVTRGASGGYYVFDIPVAATLDLKKAAKAVGEKSVAMLPSKELLPLTGYVHGGCSPVGMKKQFPTVFHDSCLEQETIYVSAGKIGFQVEVAPQALMDLVRATAADVIVDE
ncbi:Cys-tRNA(Pro) deacylase [Pseudoflavonifractor capillosus]|uniref:Cys-tRNA(Pro) deacylase n=1 Tax=Pseudoflavonifractor capillosus TaxID=106588 RepID=UPI00195BFFAC|nr:Cys-tRNA(Pro) deacylase [Pseudoflavonifractor capillosus]MBM6896012.1 Cys-tRNA(Pro) deacylase [Pseudoflavonifractor capillosus]